MRIVGIRLASKPFSDFETYHYFSPNQGSLVGYWGAGSLEMADAVGGHVDYTLSHD
jgi:hypothetical protein